MLRLFSMIGMLLVLGLLIAKASDPRMWAWLAGDEPAASAPRKSNVPEPAVLAASETVTPGPTDEDFVDRAEAVKEFMALADGGLAPEKVEMPAYWRLFGWVRHQSTAELRKRASKEVVFNQFIRDPDEQRGKLFQIELNVRQVLAYDAPPNNAGVKKVYEIRGWSEESKAWLYLALVAELPPGMPVGTDVYERATFVGYFYKLQGYHEAGASPRDKPLPAPLLIGRISWRPSELQAMRSEPQDWTVAWWIGGVAVVFGILRMGLWLYGRYKPAPRDLSYDAPDAPHKRAEVQRWLARDDE